MKKYFGFSVLLIPIALIGMVVAGLGGCGGGNKNNQQQTSEAQEATVNATTEEKIPNNTPFEEVVKKNGKETVMKWLVESIKDGETPQDFANTWKGCNYMSTLNWAEAHWEEAKEIVETEKNGGYPKWKGAKTLEELKRKIGGTYWYAKDSNMGGWVINLHFNSGGSQCTISKSPIDREDWDVFTVDCKYQIDRTVDGNRAEIILGKTYDDNVSHSGYKIKFTTEAQTAYLWQFDHKIGWLSDKKYVFDHSDSI